MTDIMNANIVRNSGQFKPTSETGFYDKSLWEEAETKGKSALHKLIDTGLKKTSVTCFLIGEKTHERPWCKYELSKTIEDGKGILGYCYRIRLSTGQNGSASTAKFTQWNHDKFADWVVQAAKDAGR